MMKKLRTKWDYISFLETRGLTLNGIPLYVDKKFYCEKKEVDPDGIVVFREIELQSELILATENYVFYVCHPEKRNWLESRVRRN